MHWLLAAALGFGVGAFIERWRERPLFNATPLFKVGQGVIVRTAGNTGTTLVPGTVMAITFDSLGNPLYDVQLVNGQKLTGVLQVALSAVKS